MTTTLKYYFNRITKTKALFVIFLLGFSSGLPVALAGGALQAWFTEAGLSLKTIGAASLLALPHTLRVLWAMLFDHYKIPGFDRRRGWLFVTQIGLVLSIVTMAFMTPLQSFHMAGLMIPWMFVSGLILMFFSTSQDIVINAYQIEVLSKEEQGLGASLYVMGWRIGVIISGGLSLVLAQFYGWHTTYLLMALLMGVGIFATVIAPHSPDKMISGKNLMEAVVIPFLEFFQRYQFKTALIFLLLIMTYKMGDAFALNLNSTFLLRHIGFDLATVGLVNKTVSFAGSVLGGITAGVLMLRLSLYRALMIFGLIQGVANLGYAIMAYVGKSVILLVAVAFTENFCSGLGTIAIMALMMRLSHMKFTATQYALLSGLIFIPQTFAGPIVAAMVESIGWGLFFVWCFILSLPTLLFVYANKNVILQMKKE